MQSFYKKDKELSLSTMKRSFEVFEKQQVQNRKNEEASSLKLNEMLKNLQDSCYQNLKMTLHMRF